MPPDLQEASGVTLRRSCQFCRLRKVKCSGEAICEQCRLRNLVCRYGVEGSKGRPKDSASSANSRKRRQKSAVAGKQQARGEEESQAGLSADQAPFENFRSSFLPNERRSSYDSTEVSSQDTRASTLAAKTSSCENAYVQQLLEDIVHRYFSESRAASPSSSSTPADAESQQSLSSTVDERSQNCLRQHHSLDSCQQVTYDGLFRCLPSDLVQLITLRFGTLGCCDDIAGTTNLLVKKVQKETVRDILSLDMDGENEPSMPHLMSHRVQQLIDVWFYNHPLSFILSKTLLLYDFGNGNLDTILLAAVLADASSEIEKDYEGTSRAEQLFAWAHLQVRLQDELSSKSLPLIQVLLLLGWHDIVGTHAARGVSYILLAWKLIVDYQASIKDFKQSNPDRINGLYVGDIKSELSNRIYWITFALALWACLQLGIPFEEVFTAHPDGDLPSTENSAVFKLDVESGNISTLRAQERVARELWQLGHITSTVASVYALYPHGARDQPPSANRCWTSGTLSRLRSLQGGEGTLENVCSNIRTVLSDGVEHLMTQNIRQPSRIAVLAAYRTMIVHFLFPHGSARSMPDSQVESITHSVSALEQVVRSLDSSCTADATNTTTCDGRNCSNSDIMKRSSPILALSIDACSRALQPLVEILRQTRYPATSAAVRGYIPQTITLVCSLHALCKHPLLRVEAGTATIKRSLRRIREQLMEACGPSSSMDHRQPWPDPGLLSPNQDSSMGFFTGAVPNHAVDGTTGLGLVAGQGCPMEGHGGFQGAISMSAQQACHVWAGQNQDNYFEPSEYCLQPRSSTSIMDLLPASESLPALTDQQYVMARSDSHWSTTW